MLIFTLLSTLTAWIQLTTTTIKLRAIEILDTYNMNASYQRNTFISHVVSVESLTGK